MGGLKTHTLNNKSTLFKSFFQGGFECSAHRRFDGKRLDLVESTLHDQYAYKDYYTLANHNIRTVRDGVRWHLIESYPNYYDWSSFMPMLRAAKRANTQVIWDLCHYGWPDDINIWKPEFVDRFAKFALSIARVIKNETEDIPFYTPINEISFWAWAGGDVALFNPAVTKRGFELKHQLIRASIAAIDAIRSIDSRARFVQAEPLINVVNQDNEECIEARQQYESQYQAWDMLAGRSWPGLGGQENMLDIIGVNYYPYNQWFFNGSNIPIDHPNYLGFAEMLLQVHKRYGRPLFVAETGDEGNKRVEWLRYICDEVNAAIIQGVPIEGLCIYPIVNYPGWDDNRYCETGLLGSIERDPYSYRSIYEPLAMEIFQQQQRFNEIFKF